MMFSKTDLRKLIIPLVIEQILAITMGFFDTLMVSSAGQNAVAGVSLVDGINVLLINIFAALGTGGAVVCAQYIGKKDLGQANNSAKQLMVTVLFISLILMGICIVFNGQILSLIFGHLDQDVIEAAKIYFFYSAMSYPFIGLFNSSAALFRAMGNSKIAMMNSLYMNIANIVLNYFMIFILHMGVTGAAVATLISRIICSLIIMYMLCDQRNLVFIDSYFKIKVDFKVIKNIMKIGIPNGLENGMFQFGKILVQRLVSTFGSGAIAAHAVAFNLTAIAIVPGLAMGLAMVTVVSQCMGANQYDQAKYYTKSLMKTTYIMIWCSAIFIMASCRFIFGFYNLPNDTVNLAVSMVILHGCFDLTVWPIAFTFPNMLRASNDATFTMVVSAFSMWAFRFGLSFVFANYLNMGVIGVWWAMIVDWIFRSVLFLLRYKSGKWQNRQLV